MRYLIVISVLILNFTNVDGQENHSIHWGDKHSSLWEQKYHRVILKENKTHFWILVSSPNIESLKVERYDKKTLVPDLSKELKYYDNFEDGVRNQGLKVIDGKMMIFKKIPIHSGKYSALHMQEVTDELVVQEKTTLIDTMHWSGTNDSYTSFKIYQSPDRKIFGVRNSKWGFSTFNADGKILYRTSVIRDKDSKFTLLKQLKLQNNGDFYFLLKQNIPDQEKKYTIAFKQGQPTSFQELYHFDFQTKKTNSVKIDFEDKTLLSSLLSIEKNSVKIAGYYSLGHDGKSGSYYIKLEKKSLKVLNKSLFTPSKAFNDSLLGLNIKNQKLYHHFSKAKLHSFFTLKDGSSIMTSEFHLGYHSAAAIDWNQEHTTRAMGHAVNWFGEIIATKFNKDGDVEWMKMIPKIQRMDGVRSAYASHVFYYNNDKLFFFFTDHQKNTERLKKGKQEKWLTKISHSSRTLTTLDLTGNISRENLTSNLKGTFCSALFVSNKKYVSEDYIYMFGITGLKVRFGKITLK